MRRGRLIISTALIILIVALVILATTGIILSSSGYRYITADNGSKFVGKTDNGIVVFGTIVLQDGTKAKIDRRLGTIEYENGDKYDGEFSGFYRHGTGQMTYASTGDIYYGDFESDVISGNGKYVAADGCVYEGEFVDGKKSGTGKFTWSDGSVYEGEFLENRKNGSGKYTGADGTSYVGMYENDKKNGKGVYTYPNGDKYTGDFVNDMRHGNGTYVWANGESYVGEFSENLKHGKGVYKWPAPRERSYDGYFEKGAVIIVEDTAQGAPDNAKIQKEQ